MSVNLTSVSRQIVYDDAYVRVVFQKGVSDFLLVSFGDMFSTANGERFFADVPATKKGFNSLGFMAKGRNWYPASSVKAAIAAVADLIASFAEIITYGGSMGGYAAIKYTSCLNAACAIAYCPQWSIDPSDCQGRSQTYENMYQPYMAGMRIKPEDVSGRVFIFYDPQHAVDSFHYEHIAAACADIMPVRVHVSDHAVTTILASANTLADIVTACRQNDPVELSHIVNSVRRKSIWRRNILLRRALVRHPLLVLRALEDMLRLPDVPRCEDDFILTLFRRFIDDGRADMARRCLYLFSADYPRMAVALLREIIIRKRDQRRIDDWGRPMKWLIRIKQKLDRMTGKLAPFLATRLVTHHQTVLYYSPLDNEFRAYADNLTTDVDMFSVRRVSVDNALGLGLQTTDGWAFLGMSDSEKIVLSDSFSDNDDRFRVLPTSLSDTFVVACGQTAYLSVAPDGSVCHRRVASAWETFREVGDAVYL